MILLVNENLKLEDKNLYKANFLFIEAEKRQLMENKYGFIISTFKNYHGDYYFIVVQSSVLGFRPTDVWNKVNDSDGVEMDYETIKEYFINGIEGYLRFENEAYIRIIYEKDPDRIKYVFTDYYEALDYMLQIEKTKDV